MARVALVFLMTILALQSPSSALRLGKELKSGNRQTSSLLFKDAGSASAVSASSDAFVPPSLAALKANGSQLAAFLGTARETMASKVNISSLTSRVKAINMVSTAQSIASGLKDGLTSVEQKLGLGEDDGPVGGIMYYSYSEGKYCDVDNDYVYSGYNESDCQRRCIQTIGCNYWTGYDSGLCQLSSTCDKEGVADDPSAHTYAMVSKEVTFSQYSVGTKCISDDSFLLEGDNMDCEQRCADMNECYYYTVYDSGHCQLSRTCTKQTAEGASSAVTYQSPKAVGPSSVVPKAGTKICSNGKLLPNLFLLGVQKAGTTSLAGDLVQGGAWNVRLPDKRSNNDDNAALVNAAGTIVGDLMSSGVMKPQDLSLQTKQAIADDLVAGGILGTPTTEHLDNETKKSLAADLVKAGVLNALQASHMDNQTRMLLTHDLVQACFMNENMLQSLDSSLRDDLAKELVHASAQADVLARFTTDSLRDTTKQMLAVDFIRAGLLKTGFIYHISDATKKAAVDNKLIDPSFADPNFWNYARDLLDGDKVSKMSNQFKELLADDLIVAGALKGGNGPLSPIDERLIDERLSPTTVSYLALDIVKAGLLLDDIVDKLSDDTKNAVVGKLQNKGLLGGDVADHLGYSTKINLIGDFVHRANFLRLSSKGQNLENATKLSITNDLLSSGIMQRSATTWTRETKELIVNDIMNAGLQNYTKQYENGFMDVSTKESHYFEHAVLEGYKYNLLKGLRTNWTAAREGWKQNWMSKLVDCPQDDTKPVYADFTPANMRMVPLPDGTTAKGRQWGILGDAMFGVNRSVPSDLVMDLPQMMNQLYGANKHKVTFVIMLREPMARMQSVYYHAKNSRGSGPCVECKGSSFGLAMNVTMMYALGKAKEVTEPTYRDWLWTSMYARQLEYWFQHFHPSQFYVIPTWVYSKGSNIQICKDLSARTKTDLDCTPFKKTVADQRNTHEHKTLDEDTKVGLRMRFYDMMNPENERLVKVLTDAHKLGLSLATYQGKKGNAADIRQWLEKNW